MFISNLLEFISIGLTATENGTTQQRCLVDNIYELESICGVSTIVRSIDRPTSSISRGCSAHVSAMSTGALITAAILALTGSLNGIVHGDGRQMSIIRHVNGAANVSARSSLTLKYNIERVHAQKKSRID